MSYAPGMRLLLPLSLLLVACPQPTVVGPPPLAVEVAADGAFSVRRGTTGVASMRGAVTLAGVDVTPPGEPTITRSEGDDELGRAEQTVLERTDGTTRLTLTLRRYANFVTAQLKASCASTCTGMRVQGFTLAGELLTGSAEPAAALANGYSSWAPSYWAAVQRTDDPGVDIENVGNNDNHLVTDARLSWWLGATQLRDGSAVVAGALTADAWKSKVLTWRNDAVKVRVRNGGAGDSLPLTAEGVSSERFFFTAGPSVNALLSAWGNAVATLTPPPAAPFVPVGWNSWNTLFENIDEAKVLANADAVKTLGFPANNVQLDDGWEVAWGGWTANARFPSGMDGLASRLGQRQLHAGVWMAPFFVDSTLMVATAHPDWFVRDVRGQPVAYTEFFTGHTLWSLDATHPEARAFLVGEVRRLLSQGYRYLKLDFLFSGAWEGVRRNPDVTSLQAYRLAMKEVLAEAKTHDAFIVACGAPVLPSAGYAHALRTGEDIAARGSPYTFDWVKNASRNVGTRWFVSPFLINDADTVLVRGLPDGVKRIQTTVNLLAGRMLGFGDDLTASTSAELDFLRFTATLPSVAKSGGTSFEPLEPAAKPRGKSLSKAEALVDPDSYSVPSVWVAKGTDEGTLVGVFNWSSEEQTFQVSAAALGLTGKEAVKELWLDRAVTFADGAWSVTVPARDAAYLRLR